MLPDAWHKGLHAVRNPKHVYAENPVPLGGCELQQTVDNCDTGVVANDVHFAECRFHFISCTCHRVGIRYVQRQCDSVYAQCGNLLPCTFERIRLDVRQGDLSTGASERSADRQSYAVCCPGDESDLAVDILHGRAPQTAVETIPSTGPSFGAVCIATRFWKAGPCGSLDFIGPNARRGPAEAGEIPPLPACWGKPTGCS